MPTSQKTLLKQQIASLVRADDRFIDMAARLRLYECSCGVPHIDWPTGKRHDGEVVPGRLIDRLYGGVYDRLNRRYTGAVPVHVHEIKCHAGQLELLIFDDDSVMRLLALGSPGAGKTFAAVRKALLLALDRPNSIGGLVAPTGDRKAILWRDFLEACPPQYIEHIGFSRGEIKLKNGTVLQFKAAKQSSVQSGSPLAGVSWDWVVVDESSFVSDESHQEIATRGRRAGRKYKIFETATNAMQVPSFRIRLEHFKTNTLYRRVNFSGFTNPWVEPEYWHRMRADMSERDFREKILAEDVPPELLVYSRFSFDESVCPRGVIPAYLSDIEKKKMGSLRDITEQLTNDAFGAPFKTILCQDFGVLINAAVAVRCYQDNQGERYWWCIDEHTSGGAVDVHSRKLMGYYDQTEAVVVADPHFNMNQKADKSDYNIFRMDGWTIHPAAHGQISKKHRIAMMQALLQDANGKRRLFLDWNGPAQPRCKRLAQSFLVSVYNDAGQPERERKTGITDPSHWPSAVGFGLYRWEKLRGAPQQVRSLSDVMSGRPSPGTNKSRWWEQA